MKTTNQFVEKTSLTSKNTSSQNSKKRRSVQESEQIEQDMPVEQVANQSKQGGAIAPVSDAAPTMTDTISNHNSGGTPWGWIGGGVALLSGGIAVASKGSDDNTTPNTTPSSVNHAPYVQPGLLDAVVYWSGGTEGADENKSLDFRSLNVPLGQPGAIPFIDEDGDLPKNLIVTAVDVGAGSLKLDGVDVYVGQVIPIARYADLNWFSEVATKGRVTFKIQDNGGTANGGQDISENEMYTTLETWDTGSNSVNHAPYVQPGLLQSVLYITGTSNTPDVNGELTFRPLDPTGQVGGFAYLDEDGNVAKNLIVTAVDVGAGSLKLDGVDVYVGQVIPIARYADLNWFSDVDTEGRLTFKVQDDGGTANGGQDISENEMWVELKTLTNFEGLNAAATAGTSTLQITDEGVPFTTHGTGTSLNASGTGSAVSDVQYPSQWALFAMGGKGYGSIQSDAGIQAIWSQYTGDKIPVLVWDNGVDTVHQDLETNYDTARAGQLAQDVGYNGNIGAWSPSLGTAWHGTAVASIIGADNNGVGMVGVAYDSLLTALNKDTASPTNKVAALSHLSDFKVVNNSWSFVNTHYQTLYIQDPAFSQPNIISAVEAAAKKGTVNVYASGNNGFNSQTDRLLTAPSAIVVNSVAKDASGTRVFAAATSNYGSNTLVSAPGDQVTGANADAGIQLHDGYRSGISGTSFAAPAVSGLVAVMFDAAPNLSVADVKDILAYSSAGVGSIYGAAAPTTNISGQTRSVEDFQWKWNGSQFSNGGGLHYSEDYGYGMVNVYNAVRMAEVWESFTNTQSAAATTATGSNTTKIAIKDAAVANATTSDYGVTTIPITVAGGTILDNVQLKLTLTHWDFLDLKIYLQAPNGGAKMMLLNSDVTGVNGVLTGSNTSSDSSFTYTFSVEGFRGLSSGGTWNLVIEDHHKQSTQSSSNAYVQSVQFTGIGTADNGNDVYHYTDEYFTTIKQSGQSARTVLTDANNKGTDWIDSAAVFYDTNIDLSTRKATVLKDGATTNYFTIASGTQIENVVTGDGNDVIKGNELSNRLYGMRGDDKLYGFAGNDRFVGGEGNDYIDGGAGVDIASYQWALTGVTVNLNAATQTTGGAGNDTLISIEKVVGSDYGDAITGNSLEWINGAKPVDADLASNTLYGMNGNDSITGGKGYDVLLGQDGNDKLYGGLGNDELWGGIGNDYLSGGTGKDKYAFDTALGTSNVDTVDLGSILPFEDKFALSKAIFAKLTPVSTSDNSLNAANFYKAAGATQGVDSNDYIVLDTTSGKLYYDADGRGGAAGVLFADIIENNLGGASLNNMMHSNFFLI